MCNYLRVDFDFGRVAASAGNRLSFLQPVLQVPGLKSYPCSCQESMEELTWEGKNLQSETL